MKIIKATISKTKCNLALILTGYHVTMALDYCIRLLYTSNKYVETFSVHQWVI